MLPTRQGSIHLFRLAGIDLYLHWSWFIVAIYGVESRTHRYSSLIWPVLEYLTLFLIVLMHEFGHALACRSVGGQANQIVLWPLGGVAYVAPPPRPGPTLWSIAAGPLVNVALAPILTVSYVLVSSANWEQSLPNAYAFVQAVCYMNWFLLIFNLMPVYPLDGGQILQSLLWFAFGRAKSIMIAAAIGFVGVAGLLALALLVRSPWLAVLAVFILLNCWRGLMYARVLARIAKLPHRPGFACPACHQQPVIGPFWRCRKCSAQFDTFETQAICPQCGERFEMTGCPECGRANPMGAWIGTAGSYIPPKP